VQAFRLNGSRVLEIDLAGDAMRAATGAMIAYTGDVSFRNAGMGGGDGLRSALKRRVRRVDLRWSSSSRSCQAS
jgi:uncharacterized protein (AIM24 family)